MVIPKNPTRFFQMQYICVAIEFFDKIQNTRCNILNLQNKNNLDDL